MRSKTKSGTAYLASSSNATTSSTRHGSTWTHKESRHYFLSNTGATSFCGSSLTRLYSSSPILWSGVRAAGTSYKFFGIRTLFGVMRSLHGYRACKFRVYTNEEITRNFYQTGSSA